MAAGGNRQQQGAKEASRGPPGGVCVGLQCAGDAGQEMFVKVHHTQDCCSCFILGGGKSLMVWT